MVEVIPGLLLGSMSDVLYLLGKRSPKRVTHLLSIINKPLDWSDIDATPHGAPLTAKLVLATDVPSTDLLTHFPACVSFIADAIEQGTILVHCEYGISRSATIVLAYLMATRRLPLNQAMDFLKEKKPDIRPNSGFFRQLKLWESMGCVINDKHRVYRAYKLRHQAQLMKAAGYMETMEMIADPSLVTDESYSNSYSCRKCRRLLFTDECVLGHDLGSGFSESHDINDWWSDILKEEKQKEELKPPETQPDSTTTDHSGFSQGLEELKKLRLEVAKIAAATQSHDSHVICSSLFIEPVEWMAPLIVGHKEGKLLCPKCSSRIGSFDWAGKQCSCGRWITPSFQVHKSKIDIIKRQQ